MRLLQFRKPAYIILSLKGNRHYQLYFCIWFRIDKTSPCPIYAFLIYFLKMHFSSHQFEMSNEESKDVKEMSIFIAILHSEVFLKSRLSTNLPVVNLKYFSLMHAHKIWQLLLLR